MSESGMRSLARSGSPDMGLLGRLSGYMRACVHECMCVCVSGGMHG